MNDKTDTTDGGGEQGLRVVATGRLELDGVELMGVMLKGSVEDIRDAGRHFYKRVYLTDEDMIAQRDELLAALKPFAAINDALTDTERQKPADTPIYGYCGWEMTRGMVSDAVAAIANTEASQ